MISSKEVKRFGLRLIAFLVPAGVWFGGSFERVVEK
jgi:hypothetical protein